MSPSPENGKLGQIRARTDRQLVALINRRIEAGIRLARQLSRKESPEAAESAFAEAALLLPAVRGIDREERWRLEAGLNRLRNLLDGAEGKAVLDTDSGATAALAHLLWLERGRPIGTPDADWFRAEEMLRPQDLRRENAA